MAVAKLNKLSDLKADRSNANRGTKRGGQLLDYSLKEYGAGRSILVDRAGNIIAGNKTARSAAAEGIENVRVIPTDGSELVVVQRTDLELGRDGKARELAVLDNRAGELNLEWDAERLAQLPQEALQQLGFLDEELQRLADGLDEERMAALAAAAVDEATGGEKAPDGYVTFSEVMLPEQLELLTRAIETAKKKHHLARRAHALAVIAKTYLKES